MFGRNSERKLIIKAYDSNRAELGVLYGRRRVGKSYLLKHISNQTNGLYFEGLQKQTTETQIEHFCDQLAKQTKTLPIRARNWSEAFDELTKVLKKGRHFVVFDELPWMANNKDELISLIKFYWDNHWKDNPGVTLVLCGSIINFMIKHVIHSKALHNRKTFELKINPFEAHDAKQFFKSKRSDFEIAKFLMIFGGIPKYLEQINISQSLETNVDQLCFRKSGFFVNEFETIFKEQFKTIKKYEAIVHALAHQKMSKESLAAYLKTNPGGSLSLSLKNLENADFIKRHSPSTPSGLDRPKTIRYEIWDEWLNFYFKYMVTHLKIIQLNANQNIFSKLSARTLPTFFGLQFERLVLKNLPNVLNALEIDLADLQDFGPYFTQGSRSKKHPTQGAQVDLLLRRKNVISLIECKFTESPVGSNVIQEMENKIKSLKIPHRVSIEKILISASGVTQDLSVSDYFDKILGLDCLFSGPT